MSAARMATRAILGLVAVLIVAACGTSGDPATDPTVPATSLPGLPPDEGPQCEGATPAHGLHVLINADAVLPGGATVHYAAAHADGTHRTADLTQPSAGTGSGARRTVHPGQRVTFGGHDYTVAQICTYRVLLTGHGLTFPADQGGAMTTGWPTTHDGR